MERCMYCGGTLVEREVSRMQEYEGHWYLIEHVPALVCEQCGEIYYTMDAHDLVYDLVSNPTKPVRLMQVEVLDALTPDTTVATD